MRTRIVPMVLGAAFSTALAASSASATESAFLDSTVPFSLQAATAKAEAYGPSDGDWEFLLAGTGSNDKDFNNGSGGFTASLGYFLTESLELGVRQSLSIADFGETTWIASTRVAADWNFKLDKFVPFIGVNLGYVYGDDDFVDETFFGAPEAGIKWFVKPETFIELLAEYQFFFENSDELDNGFEDGQFVYTLGIGFLF